MELLVCTMQRHPPHQCCGRNESTSIADQLKQEAARRGVDLAIIPSGCMNMCRYGPYIRLAAGGKDWTRVSRKDIPGIVEYIAAL